MKESKAKFGAWRVTAVGCFTGLRKPALGLMKGWCSTEAGLNRESAKGLAIPQLPHKCILLAQAGGPYATTGCCCEVCLLREVTLLPFAKPLACALNPGDIIAIGFCSLFVTLRLLWQNGLQSAISLA